MEQKPNINTAIQLIKSGDYVASEHVLRTLVAEGKKDPRVLYYLGLTSIQLNRPGEAIEWLEQLEKLVQSDADTLYYLGLAYQQVRRYDIAEAKYRRCLQLNQGYHRAHHNLGVLYLNENRFELADASFQRAMSIDSHFFESQYQLAVSLFKQQRYVEAINFIENLGKIEDALEYKRAKLVRVDCLERLRRYKDAIDVLEKDNCDDITDQSIIRRLISNYRGGENYNAITETLLNVLKRGEVFDGMMVDLASAFLIRGQYESGWKWYQMRYKKNSSDVVLDLDEETLYKKHIVVVKEQGLGDELFFLRFLPHFLQINGNMRYRSRDKMQELLANTSSLGNRLISPDDTAMKDVLSIRVGDLAYYYSKYAKDNLLPAPFSLVSSEEQKNKIRELYQISGDTPLIGISWRAGTVGENKYYKELPLQQLMAVLENIDGIFVVLQRNPAQQEITLLEQRFSNRIIDASKLNDSLEAMLGMTSLLADYYTVSNTNVYLRAALGKIAHVFIPHPPEWRWMAQGDLSPWFPNMRVYRQNADGDWSQAIKKAQDDIVKGAFRERSKPSAR